MNIEFKINLKIEKEAVNLEAKSKEEETSEHNTNERTEGDQIGSQIYNFTITGGSNNANTSNNEYHKQCKMDLSSLKELVNNDNLEDVLSTLRDDKNGFKTMLDDKLLPDTTVLIIKLLSKICNSNLEENVSLLLTSVLESDFSQKMITFVSTLALQTPKEKNLNKYFWDDPDDFWINVITLSKTFNKLLPSSSCNFNLKIIKIIKIFIPHIEENHNIHISDSIKNGFVDLCDVIQKISKDVENKEEISKGHQSSIVSTDSDVLRLPEVRSDLFCEAALSCGHYCKKLSHVEDRNHENYECRAKCEKLLCNDPKHVCRKFCFEQCGTCSYPVESLLYCGHSATIECHLNIQESEDEDEYDSQYEDKYKCTVLVDTLLPCLHRAEIPCSASLQEFQCPFPCDSRIEKCGHACSKSCHIRNDPDHLKYICEKICKEKCKKCDHSFERACNVNPSDIICEEPCKKLLPCGHQCMKRCSQKCGDCHFQVEKIVPECNHKVKISCCQPPSRKFCKEKCPRKLTCGHLCKNKCNEKCVTKCMEIIDCFISSPCGHKIKKISCYIKNNLAAAGGNKVLLQMCTKRCNTVLLCNHKCVGTCASCFQGRFHQRCKEKCGVPLVCGHECPIPCKPCKPCKKPCEFRCVHSKCKKLCGSPCIPCKESCRRSCKHQNCSKTCGEFCDVGPCEEPCTEILNCGHDCIGFCGDPCPKLCRFCDKDKLNVLFSYSDDARFIELQDCGHVLESIGMKHWLNRTENEETTEIKPILVCPKCKTAITITLRYSDYVKARMNDIQKVKAHHYGDPEKIKATKDKLILDMKAYPAYVRNRLKGNVHLCKVYEKLFTRLNDTKDNCLQNIDMMDLDAIRKKLVLINKIFSIFFGFSESQLPTDLPLALSDPQIKFIASCLDKNIDSITQQEADDLKLEIDRLHKWIRFEIINYQYQIFKYYLHLPSVKNEVRSITQLLESPVRYIKNSDDDQRLDAALKNLMVLAKTIPLNDSEKKEIVKAIGSYDWFKCPNGHYYVIGGSRTAVEVSKCYECGEAIGGTNHILLYSNRKTTEMDFINNRKTTEMDFIKETQRQTELLYGGVPCYLNPVHSVRGHLGVPDVPSLHPPRNTPFRTGQLNNNTFSLDKNGRRL